MVMGECCVCYADELHPPAISNIDGSLVCNGCLQSMFEKALRFENDYPVRWGIRVLHVDDFRTVLPEQLIKDLKAKIKEYETPPDMRIYCKAKLLGAEMCSAFIGPRESEIRHTCKICHQITCAQCGDPAQPAHVCRANRDTNAFEGLTRGKDYQLCPSTRCGRKVQLRDGCNHIVCVCGQQLCFICGQSVEDGSGHWTKTTPNDDKCPRFGQPGQARAIWDGHDDEEFEPWPRWDDVDIFWGVPPQWQAEEARAARELPQRFDRLRPFIGNAFRPRPPPQDLALMERLAEATDRVPLRPSEPLNRPLRIAPRDLHNDIFRLGQQAVDVAQDRRTARARRQDLRDQLEHIEGRFERTEDRERRLQETERRIQEERLMREELDRRREEERLRRGEDRRIWEEIEARERRVWDMLEDLPQQHGIRPRQSTARQATRREARRDNQTPARSRFGFIAVPPLPPRSPTPSPPPRPAALSPRSRLRARSNNAPTTPGPDRNGRPPMHSFVLDMRTWRELRAAVGDPPDLTRDGEDA